MPTVTRYFLPFASTFVRVRTGSLPYSVSAAFSAGTRQRSLASSASSLAVASSVGAPLHPTRAASAEAITRGSSFIGRLLDLRRGGVAHIRAHATTFA